MGQHVSNFFTAKYVFRPFSFTIFFFHIWDGEYILLLLLKYALYVK